MVIELILETGKVAGIHWLYNDPSHAAELTAGYKNDQLNGYTPVNRPPSEFSKIENLFRLQTCLPLTMP